jgi:glycosyltransferase involved in cell wall biosynthesis
MAEGDAAGEGKRILFVSSRTGRPWGAETSLRILLSNAPPGWEFLLMSSSELIADSLRPFVKLCISIPPPSGRWFTQARRLMTFAASVFRLKGQYDMLVFWDDALFPLAFLRRFGRLAIPMVADIHRIPWERSRSTDKRLLEQMSGTIANSRYVADWRGTVNVEVVPRPIYEGEPPAADETQTQDSPTIVLGIIGRADTEKRIEVAIDAVYRLPARFKLCIYGDLCLTGEYGQELRRRASRTNQIVFRGYLDTEEIYREVDAVIVCNPTEAFGRTVGEAMVRSKVVFVPDRGGAKELVDDSVSGFVYRALDAESLARAIELAYGPDSEINLLRLRARQKIISELSPEVIAQRYFGALASFAK